MKIGLYSERARTDIVVIHKEINQSNIGQSTAAMKAFRNELINSPLAHHKKVSSFPDFYSLSMFRDLLFHVQEHRFTVPELKICLTELGLEFCGFEGDRIVKNFVNQNFAKDDLYDLEKWAKFEEHTCYAFLGMYQFWCQKAA